MIEQAFFYELLKHHPGLLYHPKIIDFFELRAFPALSASSYSSRLQSIKDVQSIAPLSSDAIGAAQTASAPMTWQAKVDLDGDGVYDPEKGQIVYASKWQETYTKKALSYVEFSSFHEWFHSKSRVP